MSDLDLSFTSVEQTTYTTPTCQVEIDFQLTGDTSGIDIVQVYATTYGPNGPGGVADIVRTVEVTKATEYKPTVTLQAGAIYRLALCPRNTSDMDEVDGKYWEIFCVYYDFPTQQPYSPPAGLPAPVPAVRQAYPKTLYDDNRIDIRWVVPGAKTYHAFNVRWYRAGAPNDATQQLVNSGGGDGLWTCKPLQPNVQYAIGVQGQDTDAYIAYSYSDWGAITASSVGNNHRLRTFLGDSGVDGGSGIRRFLNGTESLRDVMGVPLY
ncbi:MAG: hypothetical protein WAN39_12930 [Candidatus Cybelea sp.]